MGTKEKSSMTSFIKNSLILIERHLPTFTTHTSTESWLNVRPCGSSLIYTMTNSTRLPETDLVLALKVLHPGKSLKAVSWGNHKFISFVSHFSGITALFYLISSTLILTLWFWFVSGFVFWILVYFLSGCLKQEGKYSPCYSILVRAAFIISTYKHSCRLHAPK